jgi:2-amino-4-hydroxy-6-hydroxymethyldihydropteridine diphosphokinase
MVLRTQSDLPPLELLDLLLAVERRAGRVREARNGPRVLDLDLLMVGQLNVDVPGLRLPHPRMWERRFVLEPLAEIAPGLADPATGRSVPETCRLLGSRPWVRKVGVLAPLGKQSV